MEAKQVPLIELLEKVPANARLEIHDPDGMGTKFIPVGKMCHEAITALRAAIEQTHDWDEVEALRESLREHMAEIQRLRAAIKQVQEPETELETYKRLYELRGKALERPCSNCGHQPAKIKAMDLRELEAEQKGEKNE